jgi:hypothetical protein
VTVFKNISLEVFMKKTVILVILVALLVPSFVSAQEAGKAEHQLFGIETGFVAGYDMNADDTVTGREFRLFFTLSESMELGFRTVDGILYDTTDVAYVGATLLDFAYFLSPTVSIDVLVGQSGAIAPLVAGGVDANLILFRSAPDDVFSTSLKLKAGYLFDEDGIAEGTLNAGLIGSVGY